MRKIQNIEIDKNWSKFIIFDKAQRWSLNDWKNVDLTLMTWNRSTKDTSSTDEIKKRLGNKKEP